MTSILPQALLLRFMHLVQFLHLISLSLHYVSYLVYIEGAVVVSLVVLIHLIAFVERGDFCLFSGEVYSCHTIARLQRRIGPLAARILALVGQLFFENI